MKKNNLLIQFVILFLFLLAIIFFAISNIGRVSEKRSGEVQKPVVKKEYENLDTDFYGTGSNRQGFDESLNTPPKNTLELLEIYNASKTINENGDREVINTDDFHIIYQRPFDQILISITNAPFEDYKLLAEAALLENVNLTEKELCRLDVVITTPSFVSKEYAGNRYYLSFCEEYN